MSSGVFPRDDGLDHPRTEAGLVRRRRRRSATFFPDEFDFFTSIRRFCRPGDRHRTFRQREGTVFERVGGKFVNRKPDARTQLLRE
jgi:hypothetical protein